MVVVVVVVQTISLRLHSQPTLNGDHIIYQIYLSVECQRANDFYFVWQGNCVLTVSWSLPLNL